jgi:hypothetical protein
VTRLRCYAELLIAHSSSRRVLLFATSSLSLFLGLVLIVDIAHRHFLPQQAEPLFKGLGKHTRCVTTSSSISQTYFNQGLAFLYGFDHQEACRSFEGAAIADPECPMAFWGIAITYGPHINNMTVTPTGEIQALSALRTARALLPKASPAEATLIEALSKRYADPPKVDRRPLDAAYADAMREAWKRFPEDLDVGALTAEAVMNLHAREIRFCGRTQLILLRCTSLFILLRSRPTLKGQPGLLID